MKALFLSLVILSANLQPIFAQNDSALPNNWYCDPRREMNLSAGTVVSIVPYVKSGTEVMRYDGYRMVEVVEFQTFDINTGEAAAATRKFMNVAGRGDSEYVFKVGEKYLFESAFTPSLVTTDDPGYYFIRPSDYVKPFSEAGAMLDFFRSVKNRSEFEEVLSIDRGIPLHKDTPGDKRHNKVRPIFPEELRSRLKKGSARVLALLDEEGKVIKAKAVCTSAPGFGEAAEKAMRASTFSPMLVGGKPVKSVKKTVYHFSIY